MFGYGYGNGYGYGVPQYYAPNQPVQQQPTPPSNDERIWVQGEAAAKAYLVANGATATLWDSERPRIFLKSVAANGFPSLQILNYSIDSPAPTPAPVETPDFDARMKRIEARVKRLEAAFDKPGEEADTDV